MINRWCDRNRWPRYLSRNIFSNYNLCKGKLICYQASRSKFFYWRVSSIKLKETKNMIRFTIVALKLVLDGSVSRPMIRLIWIRASRNFQPSRSILISPRSLTRNRMYHECRECLERATRNIRKQKRILVPKGVLVILQERSRQIQSQVKAIPIRRKESKLISRTTKKNRRRSWDPWVSVSISIFACIECHDSAYWYFF